MDWIYFDCYDCVNFVWTIQNHLRVNLKNLTVSHEFNKKQNQDVLFFYLSKRETCFCEWTWMQLRMSLQQQLIFPVETLQLSLNQSRSSLYEARQTKDTAWLVSTNSLCIPSMGVDEYSEKTSDVIRFRRQASYPTTDLKLLRSWKFPSAGIPEIIWSAMTCGGGIRRSIGLVAMSCDDSVVVRLL